jgi:transglutaminase-like putative cysteine protease
MRYLITILILLFGYDVSAQGRSSFAELNLELAQGQMLPLKDSISFHLIATDVRAVADSLAEWDNISAEIIDRTTLEVTMSAQPIFSGEISDQYSKASFVVDFDETSTAAFISGFEPSTGSAFQLENMAMYVSEYIDEPNYIHGFNIASVVADQRSGDCTEYAVLTTALARSLKLPARVVIGTVIIEEDSYVSAVGHAWTEVRHNEQWQILDAALYGSVSRQLFYLPASELGNEGPGFTLGLFSATSKMPSRIEGLKSL